MGSIGIESLEEKKPRFWEPKFLKNANLIENLVLSLVCCSGKSERRVKVFCFLVFSVEEVIYHQGALFLPIFTGIFDRTEVTSPSYSAAYPRVGGG